jgi:hypothetical protein
LSSTFTLLCRIDTVCIPSLFVIPIVSPLPSQDPPAFELYFQARATELIQTPSSSSSSSSSLNRQQGNKATVMIYPFDVSAYRYALHLGTIAFANSAHTLRTTTTVQLFPLLVYLPIPHNTQLHLRVSDTCPHMPSIPLPFPSLSSHSKIAGCVVRDLYPSSSCSAAIRKIPGVRRRWRRSLGSSTTPACCRSCLGCGVGVLG